MTKLHVKNGFVFDPFNSIEGEKKDILIEDGKVVDKFVSSSDVKEIDAKGKTVIPAALEIHAHVASQQLNWVRLLGSNNQDFQNLWNGLTLNSIAKDYVSNGYTFILEANVFPSLTKQTIFDLQRLPVLDKAFLLNTSNLWALELEFQKELVEEGNDFGIKRSQIFHLAHASSYNIDGDNSELIKFYNENQEFDMDLGFIGFNTINPLITSDRQLINKLINSTESKKLIRSSVESEGDSFATLRKFSKKKKSDCLMWGNAIDLALNISPWQLQFSVNYPNYADISNLPEIASWLMTDNAREQFMKDFDSSFLKDNILISNDKILTFNEFIILTRSSPAKSLGIGSIKGNLGLGTDGDLNILNLNLNDTDISRDYEKFKSALSNIEYVIKAGEIIKNHEKINLESSGKILWASGKPEKEDTKSTLAKKEAFYQKFYSNFYDSYTITANKEILRNIA